MREMIAKGEWPEGECFLRTDFQTAGRGQTGNGWESEEGKNLLCSILLPPRQNLFELNVVTSVAVHRMINCQLSIVNSQSTMFRMVSRLHVPYILMSQEATMRDMLLRFARDVDELRSYGQKDIILDPGFGFGKTLEQNYAVASQLEQLQILQLPILVGFSRKSMIYRLLGTQPEQALNGTSVLNTVSLTKGASILRVHDVREAVECVRIV